MRALFYEGVRGQTVREADIPANTLTLAKARSMRFTCCMCA